MFDYSQGKIYKLTCETGKVYVGSTIKSLKKRYAGHKAKANKCITQDFINPKIELIETYSCETRQQLLWKEREWIEKTDCVNSYLPILTYEEKKEKDIASSKKYREENPDAAKEYCEKNKEKLLAKSKEYYQKNKERLNEKITCECGAIISRQNKTTHVKRKKHLNHVGGLN